MIENQIRPSEEGQSSEETQFCDRCQTTKSINDFRRHKTSRKGREHVCKSCRRRREYNWVANNRDKTRFNSRVSHYTRTYGLSKELAVRLATSDRKGTCEICGEYEPLVVDHCHISKIVRGFLCAKCNALLGMANEKIVVLLSAIDYLKKHQELKAYNNT